jgi:riboflavin kinase / FMN adenylyltransferase
MELIRGTSNLRDSHRGCVVTIGTFDGIHVGHQALIRRVAQRAAEVGRAAMLLTFEPTPREYLAPDAAPARLTTLRERCRILARLASAGARLDALCVLRFDEKLRQLSGGEFAHLLARDLSASEVVVGHDFRFGHGAAGSADALREAGPGLGFQVEVMAPIVIDGERVSSSGVRAALASGDFARACGWLGRRYSMLGRVVAGERLGRRLGFPTANIRPGRRRLALGGIFAVRVHAGDLEAHPGVASLGTRPTVNGVEPLLEAHVFDFDGDLYGRELEVEFVAKLRDEQHFESLDALVEQMHRDAENARRALE